MPLLDAFKADQQALELVFPRKGPLDPHPQRMDGSIEEPLQLIALGSKYLVPAVIGVPYLFSRWPSRLSSPPW